MPSNSSKKDEKKKLSRLQPSRFGSQPSLSSQTPSKFDPIYMPSNLDKTIGRSNNVSPSLSLYLSKRDKTSTASLRHSKDRAPLSPLEAPPTYSAKADYASSRMSTGDQIAKLTREASKMRLTPPTSSKTISPSLAVVASFKSRPPAFAKSTLRDAKDFEMASHQTEIDKLPPREAKLQEEWAQKQIKLRGSCPGGAEWEAIVGGYQCTAEQHMVTNEMLREGRGGTYFQGKEIDSGCDELYNTAFVGPYYLDTRGCRVGVWRLGDIKDKPEYFPETLSYDGITILE